MRIKSDHVIISDNAKNLITKILNLDPSKRPKLDEITDHPFFQPEASIPKTMPNSTLACAPSAAFLKQYLPAPSGQAIKPAAIPPQKFDSTVPINNLPSQKPVDEYNKTERINIDKELGKKEEEGKSSLPISSTKPIGIWVKKWVDYSSKYGLGYLLTNGQTGVFFNDSTKIILNLDGQ